MRLLIIVSIIDWVRCVEKKASVDPQRVEANQLYDFIVQWAAKKAYPESRMLSADVQFFFKEYPAVKAKMGSLKISEYCSAYPDLFDIRHDGTAGTKRITCFIFSLHNAIILLR